MLKQALRGRPLRAVMAVVVASTTLVAGSFGATSGAAPQTKALSATCLGTDDASISLLKLFGGSLELPFEIVSDVPATLQPEESGSPISFTWKLSLSADVVNKAVAVDQTLSVSNVVLDMGVKGPTSTTEVQGRPAPFDVNLVANQAATIAQGPFSGTLEGVGKGGVIRYAPSKVALTIAVDAAGKAQLINVNCNTSGVAATTSIKIPGSPDITQPITVPAQAGQTVNVDVLGQYVKAGVDEKGQTLPVDPSSLKVVDGPATVTPDNQLAITAGAAGSTVSATFEVCSGTLPGVNEVQRLAIDPSNDAMRRTVGFTVKQGDAETAPIWLAKKWIEFPQEGGNLIGNLFNGIYLSEAQKYHPELTSYPEVYPKPVDWRGESFGFFFTDRFVPSAGQIDAALETLPGIGKDGVTVLPVEGQPFSFDVVFDGPTTKERDVPQLAVGSAYTILPRETLDLILKSVADLTPEPPPPGTPTAQEQFEALQAQLNAAIAAGDYATAVDVLGQMIAILPDVILGGIEVQPIIDFLTGLFPLPPLVSTTIAGETPTPICSQGIVDVTAAGATVAEAVAFPEAAATPVAEIKFAG